MADTTVKPLRTVHVATSKGGRTVEEALGGGAPGAYMLDCAQRHAPRTKNAQSVAVSKGARAFLNAGMRNADRTSHLVVYGAGGRPVVEVRAEGEA